MYRLTANFRNMSKKSYVNDLLGKSKYKIKKEWLSVATEINNAIKTEPEKLAELNDRYDKCVEAFYAVDCGEYWKVTKSTIFGGVVKTIKVSK